MLVEDDFLELSRGRIKLMATEAFAFCGDPALLIGPVVEVRVMNVDAGAATFFNLVAHSYRSLPLNLVVQLEAAVPSFAERPR